MCKGGYFDGSSFKALQEVGDNLGACVLNLQMVYEKIKITRIREGHVTLTMGACRSKSSL